MTKRRVLRLAGSDAASFLQGLVTNDIAQLDKGPIYAALLTPQGKYIADFFLVADGADILMDVSASLADALVKRLGLYKLRADVTITETDLNVQRGTGAAPEAAWPDPRHPDLGWRRISEDPEAEDGSDWDRIRVRHCIPETGIELTPDSYILESGFERLHGVDFRKGCYVGQEVTARMKHKTELKKGLATVHIAGKAEVGSAITVGEKTVGTLYTQSHGQAIAYLRFDRAQDGMRAGTATVTMA